MLDFRMFTGWVVVWKTATHYPEYKEEQWLSVDSTYKGICEKAQTAIQEYYARDIIIYYVVDGIAENVINDFNTAIKNMRGKKK